MMEKDWKHVKLQCTCVLAICMLLGTGKVANADTVISAQPETPVTTEQRVTTQTQATTQVQTTTEQQATTEKTASADDKVIQGWNKEKTVYYENGKAVTGMKKIDGILYYFTDKGKLYTKTGMREIDDKYYFFGDDHSIKTGVVQVKDSYFYFDKKSGVRYEETGVKKVNGKYYQFAKNHELVSGWYRNKKNKRYYFDKKTFEAKVGWNYIGKYKYYFEKNGQLCQDLRKKMATAIKKQKSDNAAYCIKVNRTASCVTVYAKDGNKGYTIPVVAFVCSAGKGTPVGSFTIRDKLRWHELMGPSWGQWCEHLTDDILFHSVYYNSERDNKSLSVKAYNKLGTMASHGCIRLTAGDSKWIYDNCAVGTKVVIYNNKKNPGPFDKPKAQKLSSNHTWDPTDPAFK